MVTEKILGRARQYIAKIPGSVQGDKGRFKIKDAATALIFKFGFSVAETESFLESEFNPRCNPQWKPHEIQERVRDAINHYNGRFDGAGVDSDGVALSRGCNYPPSRLSPSQRQIERCTASEHDKPKSSTVFFRLDNPDGTLFQMIRETKTQNEKKYKFVYHWAGFRYENAPKKGGKVIEDWIHLYDDGAGENYQLVHRLKFSDGRKMTPIYHWSQSNGRYVAGSGGLPRIPYNAVQVKEAQFVYIVEGEKASDALSTYLQSKGVLNVDVTVTTFGGANNFDPSLSCWFTGKDVLVMADNDKTGRESAEKIASYLYPVAKSVRILTDWGEGFKVKGDIADYLENRNGVVTDEQTK